MSSIIHFNGPNGRFGQSFMTFRGIKINDSEFLNDYKSKIG